MPDRIDDILPASFAFEIGDLPNAYRLLQIDEWTSCLQLLLHYRAHHYRVDFANESEVTVLAKHAWIYRFVINISLVTQVNVSFSSGSIILNTVCVKWGLLFVMVI